MACSIAAKKFDGPSPWLLLKFGLIEIDTAESVDLQVHQPLTGLILTGLILTGLALVGVDHRRPFELIGIQDLLCGGGGKQKAGWLCGTNRLFVEIEFNRY